MFLHKDVDSELGTPIKNPLNGHRTAPNGNDSKTTNGAQETNGNSVS